MTAATMPGGSREREPGFLSLGNNTFRPGGSTLLRSTLYVKNAGTVSSTQVGLVRTDSPISGDLLLSRQSPQLAVKDPLSGHTLKFKGGVAQVTTPMQKQQLTHSKHFYLTRDADITMQTLRNTTKVTRWTNEKVGTAGTPTGMDDSLRAYKEAQQQQRQQELIQQQQAAELQH